MIDTGTTAGPRVVGLDVGGTKTQIRVDDGVHRADRIIPTIEWRPDEDTTDTAGLHVLMGAIRSAGGSTSDPLAIGAHGCDSPSQIEALTAAVSAVHNGPVLVVNDAGLIVPAAGHTTGIAIIAGTGSIVVGVDPAGTIIAVGGHGWLLSDPASAPSIVREAAKAVLHRFDRIGDTGVLGEMLFAAFGTSELQSFAEVFSREAGLQSWARLAPLVFDAADRGDVEAARVIDDEAARLAELTFLAVQRGAEGKHIVAAGGVVTAQQRHEHALAGHLARLLPQHTFEVLREPPVAGAIRLARTLIPTNQQGA